MTVIDIHGHVSSPAELYAYRSILIAGRGAHGRSGIQLPKDKVLAAAQRHVSLLDAAGTDMQFISPRPFQLMHSEEPAEIVHWWARATNDAVAAQVQAFPERFRGVAALPQAAGTTPESWIEELERCVDELGFVGVLINPDPAEGQEQRLPRIGHEWWYPLFEKMVELNVPGLVHSGGCKSWRESYSEHMITESSRSVISLAESNTFRDFPDLKLIMSHGGGSVPYQIGRWRAARYLENTEVEAFDNKAGKGSDVESFDDSLSRLYFDSLVHYQPSLELLIRLVGADRVLFGTEVPGSGSPINPETGRSYDDLRPLIESISWLEEDEKEKIFSANAQGLYKRL
ncbi:amidohydrolase family protein [Arthrobacter sp. zg-Y1219]|uniref:amidohydrolase family protein n=1 Tax=Arthrobacter sp. zg-Y1219 TaxID=3049067 RepID=UPI0024C27E41|nr:amidohydrolase family protein [Arthrobacter sp. zg-Y1219]MDK1361687.1 amidohydrolase family protein [Arthrobacter sp. zg-Y1219]